MALGRRTSLAGLALQVLAPLVAIPSCSQANAGELDRDAPPVDAATETAADEPATEPLAPLDSSPPIDGPVAEETKTQLDWLFEGDSRGSK